MIVETSTCNDVSTRIAQRLAASVGPRRYAMWFDRSARLDYHTGDQTLRVAVPNRFAADWIGRNFCDDLQEAASAEVGGEVVLKVEVDPDSFLEANRSKATVKADERTDVQPPVASRRRQFEPRMSSMRPHRLSHAPAPGRRFRHRLEDFVVGPSNQLAFAAAQRMADEEGEPGHPLFLHGGCGLGKTHLLQGVCRRLLEHQPDARVLYTTGEQFTNDYITAVRTNKLESFRKRIRELDLLAVDDVHFIANKQATQQEFLHSFDQIDLCGARVVLASDCHPKLIKQFSEALISRCVRGLVVPIKTPDAGTRVRLVKALADRRRLSLQDGAARSLANHSTGSVREIEGMLAKLQALVALTRQSGQVVEEPIGHSLVQQLLHTEVAMSPARPVQFSDVLKTVSEELGVSSKQVMGNGRHKTVVLARSLAIYLTRQMTSMSYPEIAAAMGRKTHSTVITAAQRIQKQIDEGATVTLPPALEPTPVADLAQRLRHRVGQDG